MKKADIIFGIHPVVEAIKSGKQVDKILIRKDLRNQMVANLIKEAHAHHIPLQFVPVEKINRITKKNHQGVLCFMSAVTYQDIEQVLPMVYESGDLPLLLILDGITDVRNFGAIARTAECAGVHAIIIPVKNTAQINADAVKTSSGALHTVNICRSTNLIKTIEILKKNGLQIIACTEKTTETIYKTNLKFPTAIILGNEERGITPDLIAKADIVASIPLMGQLSSLNASVAAGVALFEAVRQRNY